MAFRRTSRCRTVLSLSLMVLAAWHGQAWAQVAGGGVAGGAGGGAGGASGGTGSTAVSGGFTGGGSSASGGYTGGTGRGGTGATSASGGFTGGSGAGGALGFSGMGGVGSGATTQTPSSANPFLSTYTNPLVAGMLNTSGQQTVNKAFGQPMYGTYSTATTGTSTGGFGGIGGMGGVGGIGGMSGTTANNPYFGFNTFGTTRTPNYAATLGDGMPRVVHPNPQLQASVADALRRSTYLQATLPINVTVKDGTVFLGGAVPTDKQRRLVEGLVRLTPGVHSVVNNIEVTETLPPPTKGPSTLGP